MSTDTDTLTTTLELAHLRAMRSADSIVFRLRDGQSTVEAIRRGDRTPDGFDQTVTAYAATSITDYTRADGAAMGNYPASGRNTYTAFHMEHTPAYAAELQSILGRMSKGDTLTLAWTRGNSSPLTVEAGVVRDELRVKITHANGKTETYLVDVAVTRDDSARMVRR